MTHLYREGIIYSESVGSDNELDPDFTVYDARTGKWYRTYFDVEMAFWASGYYNIGPLNQIKSEPLRPYKQIESTFEVYKVPLVGIDINYQMNYNANILNKIWSDNNL